MDPRRASVATMNRVSVQLPQAVDPRYLQPVRPEAYPTGYVQVGQRQPDSRRVTPRIDSASSVGSGVSIGSEAPQKQYSSEAIKQAAKKRHTRLFTDSNGRVIDVDFKEISSHQTCPECQGECGNTGVAKSCCWVLWISIILIVCGAVGGGLGYYFSSQKTAPGQSCTSSAKCVDNAVCTNLLCTCSPSYYVSGTICRARILVGQSCTSANQCVVNTYCNATCQCLPAYYYDTSLGYCNLRGSYNSICTQDSQCLTTSSQCFTLTTGRCGCPANMYYDKTNNACFALKVQGATCNDVSECIANSYCTSSVAGQCQCLTSHYYSSGACLPRVTIGYNCSAAITGQCIANAQCITLSGATTTTCQCNTGYYADTASGTCQLLIQLDQSCTSNAQCITNAECRIDYGMSYKQCKCISYYYADLTPAQCFATKQISTSCNADKQCISFASCYGSPFLCRCNSGFWFNASSVTGGYGACLVLGLPGTNCYQTSNCIANSICQIPSGGTIPKCDCASGFYFSSTTSTCVSRQSVNTACTFDQQCVSNNCNLQTSLCN